MVRRRGNKDNNGDNKYPLDRDKDNEERDQLENNSKQEEQEQEEQEQEEPKKYNPEMTDEEADEHFDNGSTHDDAKEIDIPIIPSGSDSGQEADGSHDTSIVPKTLAESLESQSDMTDMQYAAHRLFPPKLGKPVYNANMISRVDPSIYLSRLHLNAIDEIMTSDPRKSIDVNEIWNKHEILLSTGLDGMGRIDLLELAGAAREEKRIEKQFGSLGAG